MTTDYVKPFVDGAVELITTMLSLPCKKGGEPVKNKDIYISGTIWLTGSAQGQVAMAFSKKTATKLVARMLNMLEREVDDQILQDGVGEMVNIVAGSAMTKLSDTEYQFNLTVPLTMVGKDHSLPLFEGNLLDTCSLQTELGNFNLILWMSLDKE
jgi:CheY-specific phosphatase CheX